MVFPTFSQDSLKQSKKHPKNCVFQGAFRLH